MKKHILNLLSAAALFIFFLLAAATSQEFDSGFFNMKIERIPEGLKLTNEDDFNYENLNIFINKTDTLKSISSEDSLVFNSYSTPNQLSIQINDSESVFFADFKTAEGILFPDTLKNFTIHIDGSCPEKDLCTLSRLVQ